MWADAKVVGTDAAGNTISILDSPHVRSAGQVHHRELRAEPRAPGGKAGNSMGGTEAPSSPRRRWCYYRVTVRVQGPRDTLSIVQSNIGIQH